MPLSLPNPGRTELEARAWSLRLRGYTQERIAADLGLHQGTVSRMLARCERRALKALRERVQRTKARQTLQLEQIQDEAMQAWERSKLPLRSAKTKDVPDRTPRGPSPRPKPGTTLAEPKDPTTRDGILTLHEGTVEESIGDPRYLFVAIQALADVRKIWAIDEASPDDPDLDAAPSDDPDEVRRLEVRRLDVMAASLWTKASAGDVRSVDSTLKVMALRAKLLGVEPPAAAETPGAVLERYSAMLAKVYAPTHPLPPEPPAPDRAADPD